jgi:ABC-type molybdenum transport system ATPase subunit/photorepair protein PhrA
MVSNGDYVFFKKVVILGTEGSGKTSLISIFEDKSFKEEAHSVFRN